MSQSAMLATQNDNLLENFRKGVSRLEFLVFLWLRRVYGGSCKTSPFRMFPTVKIGGVSHEMFVLVLPPVSFRVSGFLVASPCLWGKLQNLYVVRDIRQNFHTPLETFEKQRLFSFPHRHGEATGNLETREDTWEHQNEHFVRDSSNFDTLQPPNPTFSYELSLELQNRCFVRGVQFSTHLTNCHACHRICTLSPLDAALPMRFAKNTQHHTSKVLRLPRKMTLDTCKVLPLPRKVQRIFWKRRKSIALATQNDFRHVTKHVECHEVPRLPRESKQREVWNLQKW